LKNFLDKASTAYYEGSPFLTDEEFDLLAAKYNYNTVGYTVTDGVPHMYRMYSLQKVFEGDTLPNLDGYVVTPKLDGAAISLVYVQGSLALALTRGDGNLGKDVTDKVRFLVPNTIPIKDTVQITGEVVCPKRIENARNVAAGSLGLKDVDEFRSRPLSFYAYDMQGAPGALPVTYIDTLEVLEASGFSIVTVDRTDLCDIFPTDGLVYRVNSNSKFESMGYTSHHPRGAFALKEQKAGVVTTLHDVLWQVGKSGVVSPVAVLYPSVEIGGATVNRATLHNIEYINDLGLEIGCQVEVIRSGEIIPRILRRVNQ